jgi:hypothetical protein
MPLIGFDIFVVVALQFFNSLWVVVWIAFLFSVVLRGLKLLLG